MISAKTSMIWYLTPNIIILEAEKPVFKRLIHGRMCLIFEAAYLGVIPGRRHQSTQFLCSVPKNLFPAPKDLFVPLPC